MSEQPHYKSEDTMGKAQGAKALSAGRAIVLLLVVVVVGAVLAATGIIGRIHARTAVEDNTNALAAPTVIVNPPTPGPAAAGDHPARQPSGLHRLAHLRPHRRLSQEVVFRYRRACSQGPAAGGDRVPRSRSAARPGPGRPRHRRDQRRQCPHAIQPLSGAGEDRLRFSSWIRITSTPRPPPETPRSSRPGQRPAPVRAGRLRENLCAL